MTTTPAFANRLWLTLQKTEHQKFWQEAPRLQAVQDRLLIDMIRKNKDTVFGRAYGFDQIQGYEDYTRLVPVLDEWQAISPFIDRIAEGETGVLTQEKVERFEETSGTTGFSKLIPYTKSLKQAFERAVAVWMTELYTARPAVFSGKAYWSVSPALKPTRRTSGGIPVGLDDDADYFNPLTAWLLRQIIVQPDVKRETDSTRFYLKTVQKLLKTPEMSFISVWSPTFFLQLDQFLREHNTALGVPDNFVWSDLFPRLACLSCWTDAQAAVWVDQVEQRLGNIPVQGKGLLSTEGVTSIPVGIPGLNVLAYRSHFYEFREVSTAQICAASALREGADYEIILSNGAGLYRYATRDTVRCIGWYRSLPVLVFLGRQNTVSDLVGEKLSEPQAIAALQASGFLKAYAEVFLEASFSPATGRAVYTLLLFSKSVPDFDDLSGLQHLEAQLSRNPYFRQALDACQLAPLQMQHLKKSPVRQWKDHIQKTRQTREGDIKIPVLVRAGSGPGWE